MSFNTIRVGKYLSVRVTDRPQYKDDIFLLSDINNDSNGSINIDKLDHDK